MIKSKKYEIAYVEFFLKLPLKGICTTVGVIVVGVVVEVGSIGDGGISIGIEGAADVWVGCLS